MSATLHDNLVRPKPVVSCLHCGDVDQHMLGQFCCIGCQGAYQFIHSQDLQEYYSLRPSKVSRAKNSSDILIEELDHPLLRDQYLSVLSNGDRQCFLYIEGIQCLACLWVLEKIPEKLLGVKNTDLDMTQQRLKLTIDDKQSLEEVVKFINSLGYTAIPLKKNEDSALQIQKEKKSSIIKLGVTAAIAGNIMLMSTGVYSGADSASSALFNKISALMAIGIVFYSATDFYREAFRSFKQRRFSVDYILSFAILAGGGLSWMHIVQGNPNVYFDSIAGLCFLILCSRYIMKYSQWKHLSRPTTSTSLSPKIVSKMEADHITKVLPSQLVPGDVFIVGPKERVSCDGELLESSALFDESFLTGEAEPVTKKLHSQIWAGSSLVANTSVKILCKKTQSESEIHQLFAGNGGIERNLAIPKSEAFAKYLSLISIFISFASLIYFSAQGKTQQGVESFLAILIITCPCAFAFASPIAIQRTLDYIESLGILVKDTKVLLSISKIKDFYFDKTGTLTLDYFQVEDISSSEAYSEESVLQFIYDLERYSKHPIASSLRNYIMSKKPEIKFTTNFKVLESIGMGVYAHWNNNKYSLEDTEPNIKNSTGLPTKYLVLKENDKPMAQIKMKNPIREEARNLIKSLIELGKRVHILSGDNKETVSAVANELNVNGNFLWNLSPEQKKNYIDKKESVFIGDGANDSMALACASISIATQGSIDTAFKSSLVYLDRCQIDKLIPLLLSCSRLENTLKTNFFFSLSYNIVFIGLASFGYIHPLSAAIIMPLGSFFLLSRSLFATRISAHAKDLKKGIPWKS